jgi:hypothetical protein
MPRRIPQESPPADLVDRETASKRASQLARRLRLSVPLESDQGRRIRKACEAAKELEPNDRLAALLDLADQLRPTLPEGVQQYTLPESLTPLPTVRKQVTP